MGWSHKHRHCTHAGRHDRALLTRDEARRIADLLGVNTIKGDDTMLPRDWKKEIADVVDKSAEHNAEAIADPLKQLAADFGGYKSERIKNDKWTLGGLLLNALLVFITAIIFYCQLRVSQNTDATFKEILVASNRAWLSERIAFTRPFDASEAPSLVGLFENVGRFPALDIKATAWWRPIDLAKPLERSDAFPDAPSWTALDKEIREGCSANSPQAGGVYIFPGTHVPEGRVAVTAPNPLPDMQPVRDRKQVIAIAGCLTYNTFESTHHTGLCRYLTDVISGQWEVATCPGGNFAE